MHLPGLNPGKKFAVVRLQQGCRQVAIANVA